MQSLDESSDLDQTKAEKAEKAEKGRNRSPSSQPASKLFRACADDVKIGRS